MRNLFLVPAAVILAACGSPQSDDYEAAGHESSGYNAGAGDAHEPPPGSNEMLRAVIAAAPELEVIVSDVVIPPGAAVPRHFHPGEEYVYVIKGSAVHIEDGRPDREYAAGEAFTIGPRAIHAPRAGENGARAIVFRVHVKGEPERILIEDEG